MRHLYDQWLNSEVSKASFCREYHLHYTTFHYWIKKFSQEDSPKVSPGQHNGFSQISFPQPHVSEQDHLHSAVLTFPSGERLEFLPPSYCASMELSLQATLN